MSSLDARNSSRVARISSFSFSKYVRDFPFRDKRITCCVMVLPPPSLPSLTTATDKLGSLAGLMDKLPEAARGPLKQIVSSGMPQLEGILNKLSAIPGVGAIIKPIVESLQAKLAMFQ